MLCDDDVIDRFDIEDHVVKLHWAITDAKPAKLHRIAYRVRLDTCQNTGPELSIYRAARMVFFQLRNLTFISTCPQHSTNAAPARRVYDNEPLALRCNYHFLRHPALETKAGSHQ
jgi:hypothetical protein